MGHLQAMLWRTLLNQIAGLFLMGQSVIKIQVMTRTVP